MAAYTDAQSAAYAARLDRTLNNLRQKLDQQEEALDKLRASNAPSPITEPSFDKSQRLRQLAIIKAAYDTITPEEPVLHSHDSPLPALLALRQTELTIAESLNSIGASRETLLKARAQLDKEHADTRDSQLIHNALESRIQVLKNESHSRSVQTSSQMAQNLMKDLQKKRAGYDRGSKRILKALNKFIEDYLAAMLAAEELGGPVAGEMLDIDESMIEAGFTHKGKAKNSRPETTNSKRIRQMQIEEIWGKENAESSEIEAAATEIQDLIERLLNKSTTGGYIQFKRDSAAVRFLVKAKVAQFHPRDASKLRLLGFGREIDS